MSYFGELIAFCTTLSWSICVFPFTEAARRLGPDAVNHFRLVLALLVLTLVFFVQHSFSFAPLIDNAIAEHWIWFGLSGIIGLCLGDYFGFTAYAILGTRLGSLFSSFSPGAALFLGYLVLDEKISIVGFIGIVITIAGVLYITLSKEEKKGVQDLGFGNLRKGILYGVISAICQGAGLVLAKKGMTVSEAGLSPIHATWIRIVVGFSALLVFTLFRGNLKKVNAPVFSNKDNGLKYAVMGTIFGPVVGVCFSMYAVSLVQVSIAQTIFSLVPVVVLPIAMIFTTEKVTLKAFFGAAIAIAGVLVLIWRDQLTLLSGF